MKIQIVITSPGDILPADLRSLREQGIVVIESKNPAAVRLIAPEPDTLPSNAILAAALHAMKANPYSPTALQFVSNLASMTDLKREETSDISTLQRAARVAPSSGGA